MLSGIQIHFITDQVYLDDLDDQDDRSRSWMGLSSESHWHLLPAPTHSLAYTLVGPDGESYL